MRRAPVIKVTANTNKDSRPPEQKTLKSVDESINNDVNGLRKVLPRTELLLNDALKPGAGGCIFFKQHPKKLLEKESPPTIFLLLARRQFTYYK